MKEKCHNECGSQFNSDSSILKYNFAVVSCDLQAVEQESPVAPWYVSDDMARLAQLCVGQNSIVQLPQGGEVGNHMELAAEVSRLCLKECNRDRKVVVIAPNISILCDSIMMWRRIYQM